MGKIDIVIVVTVVTVVTVVYEELERKGKWGADEGTEIEQRRGGRIVGSINTCAPPGGDVRRNVMGPAATGFPVIFDFYFSPWHVVRPHSSWRDPCSKKGIHSERCHISAAIDFLFVFLPMTRLWTHTLPAGPAYPAYLVQSIYLVVNNSLCVHSHLVPFVDEREISESAQTSNWARFSLRIASRRRGRQFTTGFFRLLRASFCPCVLHILHILHCFLSSYLDQRIVTGRPFMSLARRHRRLN